MDAPIYDEQKWLGSFFNIANLRASSSDILGFAERTATLGGLARFRVAHEWAYLASDPAYVKHVLQDNAKNYGKNTYAYNGLRDVLGTGLLTNDAHSSWLANRRLAQPLFHRERLAGFVEIMCKHTRAMVERIGTKEGVFDLQEELNRLTLGVVGESIMGAAVEDGAQVIAETLPILFDYVQIHLHDPLAAPPWVPTKLNRQFSAARKRLRGFVQTIVEGYRANNAGEHTLLGMLVAARDAETNEQMSDEALLDEVMTMILAGHETTSNALGWTVAQLANEPEARNTLRAHVGEVLNGAQPSWTNIGQLSYARAVVQESLRLMPPAWGLDRRAIAADTIGGFRIPKGSVLFVCPWVTHRLEHLWDEPLRFLPARFTQGREFDRFTYMPFGAGPRMCIGHHFAMTEMVVVLSMLTQAVDIEVVEPPVPWPSVTLRPKNGLRVRASKAATHEITRAR
jgi:cytochrome P450